MFRSVCSVPGPGWNVGRLISILASILSANRPQTMCSSRVLISRFPVQSSRVHRAALRMHAECIIDRSFFLYSRHAARRRRQRRRGRGAAGARARGRRRRGRGRRRRRRRGGEGEGAAGARARGRRQRAMKAKRWRKILPDYHPCSALASRGGRWGRRGKKGVEGEGGDGEGGGGACLGGNMAVKYCRPSREKRGSCWEAVLSLPTYTCNETWPLAFGAIHNLILSEPQSEYRNP